MYLKTFIVVNTNKLRSNIDLDCEFLNLLSQPIEDADISIDFYSQKKTREKRKEGKKKGIKQGLSEGFPPCDFIYKDLLSW